MQDMNYEKILNENDPEKLYTISEANELPSHGKIYGKGGVRPFVELRSMTTRDEMKRCSPSPFLYKNTAKMIKDCIVNTSEVKVDPYDMALGDYEFLLHKLRIITYGSDYKMACYCGRCNKYVECVADLDQETVNEFDYDDYSAKQYITLPVSGDMVKLRIHTPHLLDVISSKIKEFNKKYKDSGLAYDILVMLIYTIEEVNDTKLDIVKAQSYVEGLKAKDMMAVLNAADALNKTVSIDTLMLTECPECGGEIETYFREGQEFFRPTTE